MNSLITVLSLTGIGGLVMLYLKWKARKDAAASSGSEERMKKIEDLTEAIKEVEKEVANEKENYINIYDAYRRKYSSPNKSGDGNE